ncbi:MAG TPA: hypothetical protein VFJ52_07640, partial [Terriglobia bacterium]|nr:hypothetical protein [Terriglobia bacterium]
MYNTVRPHNAATKRNDTMKPFTIENLKDLSPCSEGLEFALSQPDMATAWDKCRRPDWLFWILERVQPLTKEQAVRLAVEFAKQALPQFAACYPDDSRPANAIRAAE